MVLRKKRANNKQLTKHWNKKNKLGYPSQNYAIQTMFAHAIPGYQFNRDMVKGHLSDSEKEIAHQVGVDLAKLKLKEDRYDAKVKEYRAKKARESEERLRNESAKRNKKFMDHLDEQSKSARKAKMRNIGLGLAGAGAIGGGAYALWRRHKRKGQEDNQ